MAEIALLPRCVTADEVPRRVQHRRPSRAREDRIEQTGQVAVSPQRLFQRSDDRPVEMAEDFVGEVAAGDVEDRVDGRIAVERHQRLRARGR